jgi:sec-independent protein translocase protein TatA
MNLGPVEIGLIVLAVMLLFGYRKLPDASRSLGRSLRIFKSEVDGLRGDVAQQTETGFTEALPGAGARSGATPSREDSTP